MTVSQFGSVKRVNGMSIESGAVAPAPRARPTVSKVAAMPRAMCLRMMPPGSLEREPRGTAAFVGIGLEPALQRRRIAPGSKKSVGATSAKAKPAQAEPATDVGHESR